MAADSFLLDTALQPTLRLYQWDGPWLSLGYAQKELAVDIPWVRRPSGGRAVLHHHEITYAIVLPSFEGSLGEIYTRITSLWLRTLSGLRSGVARAEQSQSGEGDPSCYQLSQRGEIQLDGQKLVGSAQLRRGQRLLQHGSIPTEVDRELFARVFPGARPPATFGPLSCQQLWEIFPKSLERRDWSPEEVARVEENASFHRA